MGQSAPGRGPQQLEPKDPGLFCRLTQQSFLRLLTTQAVFLRYGVPPLGNEEAWSVYELYRANPRIEWADEPADLDAVWKRLSSVGSASPKLWMDAYLAA
jgi:uncharacterized protein